MVFFPCVGEIEAFVPLQRSKGELELSAAFLVFSFSPESKQFQQKIIIILIVKPFTYLVTTHGNRAKS